MPRILYLVCAFMILAATAAAAAPVEIAINWEYRNFAAAVEIFEVKGRQRLWKTESVQDIKDAPVAGAIEGSGFTLAPGKRKRFALVVRNQTSKPLYFFAAPHAVYPVEHALGFKFKCLCINHAFIVGPGEVWYRIVEFGLSKNFLGDELTISHTIVGIDRKRAKAFSRQPTLPDP